MCNSTEKRDSFTYIISKFMGSIGFISSFIFVYVHYANLVLQTENYVGILFSSLLFKVQLEEWIYKQIIVKWEVSKTT